MLFAIPIVWRKGKAYITDCYFCMMNLKGIKCKNKHHVQYPDVLSTIRPIPHGLDLPVPDPHGNMECSSDSKHNDMTVVVGDNASKPEVDDQLVPMTQAGLNNLTQELSLLKESAQLLGSCLKDQHLLALGTTFYWYWDWEKELRQFFIFQDKSSLVYCNYIAGLINGRV